MRIYSLPDITLAGFSSPTVLSATSRPCKWFQVNVLTASGANLRIGDSSVSASQGAPMAAGGGQFSPPIAEASNLYDLANEYIAGTLGDTVAVIYGI